MISRTQGAFQMPPAGRTRPMRLALIRTGDRAHLDGGIATVERTEITPDGGDAFTVRLLLRTATGRTLTHTGRATDTLPCYLAPDAAR